MKILLRLVPRMSFAHPWHHVSKLPLLCESGIFIGMRDQTGDIIAMAGRDAGPYHNVVAAPHGTRGARHACWHESELVLSLILQEPL